MVSGKFIYAKNAYQTRRDASSSCLDLDINSARRDKGTQTSCRGLRKEEQRVNLKGAKRNRNTSLFSHAHSNTIQQEKKVKYHRALSSQSACSKSTFSTILKVQGKDYFWLDDTYNFKSKKNR